MYKILIKKPQLPKDTFTFYSETTSTVNEETGEVSKTTAIYETDNLDIKTIDKIADEDAKQNPFN